MKKYGLSIAILATLIFSLFVLNLIVLPAWAPRFNYSTSATANIATTIYGIVSPALTLLTIVLLYMTLSKQNESIKEQKTQNNSDAIVASIQLCQKAIDDFYYKTVQGDKMHVRYGNEGIFDFIIDFCYASDAIWRADYSLTYASSPEAKKISWIISTFGICYNRVMIAQVPVDVKLIFQEAISAFYFTQLSHPIKSLCSMFHVYPHLMDDEARKVQMLYKMMEKREWDEVAKEAIVR